MKHKEIIAKLLKGEKLTAEEQKFLDEYDPEKAANDAAAAARVKAEAAAKKVADELEALKAEKAKSEAEAEKQRQQGLTDAQKLAEQIAGLQQSIGELKDAKAEADKKAAKLERAQRLAHIRMQEKIAFIDGVDPALVEGAFGAAFEGLDDLENSEEVKARVTAFVSKNKALIKDDSGHGAGVEGTPPAAAAAKTREIEAMSDADRAADMAKKGIM